jgi:methyl acetate hydrolase
MRMTQLIRWPCVAAATCGLIAPLAGAPPNVPRLPPGGEAALTRFLQDAVGRGDVPGIVALVVNRRAVLFSGAAGKQDVARQVDMRGDTVFRIASMTKPITSTAVMMLVDGGRLGLNDPVSKYLPEFEGREVISSFNAADATYELQPARRAVTIRHLLTHTSGIGYAWSNPIVARLQQATKKSETTLPLLHDPGERWTYGASTRVLGQVVERISGQPLDSFLRARILEPLKMTDTAYVVSPHNLSRVVTVHQRSGGALTEQPNGPTQESPVRGDGGLYSTAGDYGRFLQMLLNEGTFDSARLLSPPAVRAMSSNQIGAVVVDEQPAANPALTKSFPLGAGRDTFGLGFQIAARTDRANGFRRPGSLSWAGIHNTHFWIDPARQIGVVVLMQVLPFYDEACIKTLRGFEELLYHHLG